MFELSAPQYIVNALKQGSFNGTVENEHGKVILERLMNNGNAMHLFFYRLVVLNILVDEMRAAILNSHITAALCTMLRKGDSALNHIMIDFLVIISDYGERPFAFLKLCAKAKEHQR